MPRARFGPLLVAVAALVASLLTVGAVVTTAVPAGAGDAPAAELPEPEPDPDEVRAEADRILSGEEFGGQDGATTGSGDGGRGEPSDVEPPPVPELAPFGGLGPVATVIMWIIVALLVALAAWVIARAIQARRRRAVDEVDEVDDEVVVVEDEAFDLAPTLRPADEWRRLADEAEAAGRWREGLRFRYRALLADLIDRRVVSDAVGRTTGEYREEVAAERPVVAAPFDDASELFDRAWYGRRPTGATERDRFRRREDEVLAGLAEPVGGPG